MSLGKLVVELSLDDNEFTLELKKADGVLEQFIKRTSLAGDRIDRVQRSTRNWGSVLRDFVITAALARDAIHTISDLTIGWQKAIIDVNADMQRSIALMKNFSTATSAAAATQEAMADTRMLLNKAASSPFTLKAITDAFVKLRVSGIHPVNESFNALTDAVAAFGGSDENLKRASVAIQQMSGKGVVSMEELRQQLGEAVPTAIQNMADGLGTTYAKLVKEISQGKVKSEPAIIAMMRQMEIQFKGSAEAMMNTWTGAVNQINNSAVNLALAFGGFNDGAGYAKGSYMATMVEQLREINQLMKDPDMVRSAQEFGHAMADVARSVGEAIKWVIQYRTEIWNTVKVVAQLYATFKVMTWGQAGIQAATAGVTGMAAKLVLLRTSSEALSGAMNTVMGRTGAVGAALDGMGNTGTRTNGAMRILMSTLGIIAGPIGMVTTLAVSGAMAWNSYRESVNKAREELLKMKGVNAGEQGLTLLQSELEIAKQILETRKKGSVGLAGDFAGAKSKEASVKEQEEKVRALEEAVTNARLGIMQDQGKRVAEERKSQLAGEFESYQLEYRKHLDELRKTRDSQMTAGNADAGKNFEKGLLDLDTTLLDKRLTLLRSTREEYRGMLEAAEEANKKGTGGPNAVDNINKLRSTVQLFSGDIEQAEKDRDRLLAGRQNLQSDGVLLNDAGKNKFVFDPLQKFVDQQTVALAKLKAGAEETNPILAQFDQIVENMADTGQSSKRIDELRAKIASVAPEMIRLQEQNKKIKEYVADAKDASERLRQIDLLTVGKAAKAQNDNPWEKASADAQRYYQELKDLKSKLTGERDAAMAIGDNAAASKAADELNKVLGQIPAVEAALAKLTVTDASQTMREQAREVRIGLMTQTEQVEAEYQRQKRYAQDYFDNHKDLLMQDQAAYQAYVDYVAALDAKHQRDTESGLDAWIRQNKDASQKYKSLWASAMDNFVDTVVDGLAEGKLEIEDFVVEVVKELAKIQVAKTAAGIAEGLGNMFANWWSGGGTTTSPGASSGTSNFGLGQNVTGGSNGTLSSTAFANGGIMTEYGALALRKYANGGIANRPQVAIYGEGKTPEAYVPLPDGRTIPVTLSATGGSQAAPASSPSGVQVNVYNQSGQQMDAESNQSFNGEQYVVDIILKNVSRPGAVRDAIKSV